MRESFNQSIIWNASNYHKQASHTDIGSTVQSMGDLRLSAGQDITLKAANVTAETGNLLATASRDINLTTGEAYSFADDAHQSKSKGFLSSKTTNTRDTVIQTTALGSTLSGETATVIAGQDLNILGGNIVSTTGTTLLAGEDVNLLAATNTSLENHFKKEKKSGLLGASGGIGFTIGSQMQSTDQKGAVATALGSVIGSTEGDVNIQAGRNYVQTGGNVLAPLGDIDILAQKVDINEARETSQSVIKTEFKSSGLTLALSSPVLSAIQTGRQMVQAAGDTGGDARMMALAGANIGLSGYNAYSAVADGQGTTINGKDNQIATDWDDQGNPIEGRDARLDERLGGINLNVSFGTSKSSSTTSQTSDSAAGSTVAAGGDVNIRAVGAGADSDLTIRGSKVTAGRNVNLLADDEISLLAAQNLADLHSANKSSSGSIGVSIGTGSGVAITANGSKGQGKAEGNDAAFTNTHIIANETATLQSGGDATLAGAVVAGKRVNADVGGNLAIESLQDLSTYNSKQQSLGGNLSVGLSGTVSGSVSASKSTVNSNFASVTEQSGIKAGDEGFNVNVKGNTTLKGAVIASTDKAVEDGKNTFTTASLAMSDIENKAEYKATSVGVTLGMSANAAKTTPQGTSAGFGHDSGSAASTTQSGVSGIAGNKDVRSTDAETGIQKIFDADKVQKNIDAQVAITQTFGQLASKAVGDYADKQMKDALAKRDEAAALPADDPQKAALLAEAQSLEDQWGANGIARIGAHTLIGGLTGGTGGAAGAAAGTLTAPAVAKALKDAGVNGPLADTLTGLAGTTAGAVAGGATGGNAGAIAGAGAALNEVANNYLNHREKETLKNLKEKKGKGECNAQCESEIAGLEKLDKDRDTAYQQAYDECRDTGKCKSLKQYSTIMQNDMEWPGLLSKNYESDGDPGKVNAKLVDGKWVLLNPNDKGGFTYGSYQIETNYGTMQVFLAYLAKNDPNSYKVLKDAGGYEAAKSGSNAFVNAWQSLSGNTSFVEQQHNFIEQKKFSTSYSYAQTLVTNLSERSAVINEIIWSGAVQHANNNNTIMNSAWKDLPSNASDEQLIREYYRERTNFVNNNPNTTSLINRYRQEQAKALDWLNKPRDQWK